MLCSCLPEDKAEAVLEDVLSVPEDKGRLQAHVSAVSRALETALDRMVILELTGSVGPVVMAAITSEQVGSGDVGMASDTSPMSVGWSLRLRHVCWDGC